MECTTATARKPTVKRQRATARAHAHARSRMLSGIGGAHRPRALGDALIHDLKFVLKIKEKKS